MADISNNRAAHLRWRQRLAIFKASFVCLAVALFVVISFYAYQTHMAADFIFQQKESFLNLSKEAGLTIENVTLIGRTHADTQKIIATLDNPQHKPMIGFQPTTVKERLLELPWIQSARVERHWPDTIQIKITEYKPFAIWQHNNKLSLVDREGTIILSDDVDAFKHYPLIIGADAPKRLDELVTIISSAPELVPSIYAATRVADRRWDIRLKSGQIIRLPMMDSAAAWQHLATLHRDFNLLNQPLAILDLRLPGQIVAKPTTTQLINLLQPGKNT